jgi:imidazole glycerol-phosphate synthase subunit HisH
MKQDCKREKRVGIIDYQLGNLYSVQHACTFAGLVPEIVSNPLKVNSYDGLILPGVGAFGEAIYNIRRLDLEKPIMDFIASGKPFLGVCLGMQLLFTESEEFGMHKGLNIIPGKVIRFPKRNNMGDLLRIPHIGWSRIFPAQNGMIHFPQDTPFSEIAVGEYMYFVHSYYTVPINPEHSFSITNYEGINYCCSSVRDNVFATQFHPEKSSQKGITIYKNWAKMIH